MTTKPTAASGVAQTTEIRKIWHYTPTLPIEQAAYFERPVTLKRVGSYLISVWKPTGLRFLILLVAVLAWTWFTPDIQRAVSFQWDWMLEILLRNFCIMLLVAGGLHLFLYTFRRQGDDLRYDTRAAVKKKEVFHFNDQVRDNMFWTIVGSVPIGTLWECVLLWCFANGHIDLIEFMDSPLWFIGLFLIIPIWSGFHFYWYHRMLHIKPLYRSIHHWHHKNVNTGPWSGHAMHPLEHFLLFSDLLLYFLIACHPIHVIFNAMLHTIGGPTSHCGYHEVRLTSRFRLQLGDFMHQLHHRFIDCNYGTHEDPWDKIFGSFHNGTTVADRYINERRRRLYASKKNTT